MGVKGRTARIQPLYYKTGLGQPLAYRKGSAGQLSCSMPTASSSGTGVNQQAPPVANPPAQQPPVYTDDRHESH
ncbi:hypothetical protein L195_g029263 [Trifolium pratense]|uniref:Uncharacterized protein n=1 Tax=Trifolium pratense TaxID=57577 RepID=A0A2K3L4B5_TRIPR|nr:hypothetical protein L195_g029263 [Trifolium pratense]